MQKVKSACNMHLIKPLNDHLETAEELFAAKNEQLHNAAKKWLLRTTENCTILSVFIATVAFAAVYTVPGGPDQKTGIPLLNSKPFFVIFVVADVISLTFALASVNIFLAILTSSFPLQDFETYLFQKLKRGIISLILSVSMMAVAFGATIVLITTHFWEKVFFGLWLDFYLSPSSSSRIRLYVQQLWNPSQKRSQFLLQNSSLLFWYCSFFSQFFFPNLSLQDSAGSLEGPLCFLSINLIVVNVGKNQISQSPQPSQV